MYVVYILESNEGKLYIGSTQDIESRLKLHNSGEGGSYTKRYKNRKIIYQEVFDLRSEAMKREKKLKSLKLGKRIKDVLGIT